MDFTVYHVASGDILRCGFCEEDDIATQAGTGEAIWPGEKLDDTKWRIVSGAKTARAADLDLLEASLCSMMDRAAEGVRALFITNTESQAGVYLVKEAEARAFLAAPVTPDSSTTPNLTREANRTGKSRTEVAQTIVARADSWRQLSAMIEDIRLGAKEAVRAATTEEGKLEAADIDWSPVTDLA